MFEICCFNVQAAIVAVDNGAKRIELCSTRQDDGLTPDISDLKKIHSHIHSSTTADPHPRHYGNLNNDGDDDENYEEARKGLCAIRAMLRPHQTLQYAAGTCIPRTHTIPPFSSISSTSCTSEAERLQIDKLLRDASAFFACPPSLPGPFLMPSNFCCECMAVSRAKRRSETIEQLVDSALLMKDFCDGFVLGFLTVVAVHDDDDDDDDQSIIGSSLQQESNESETLGSQRCLPFPSFPLTKEIAERLLSLINCDVSGCKESCSCNKGEARMETNANEERKDQDEKVEEIPFDLEDRRPSSTNQWRIEVDWETLQAFYDKYAERLLQKEDRQHDVDDVQSTCIISSEEGKGRERSPRDRLDIVRLPLTFHRAIDCLFRQEELFCSSMHYSRSRAAAQSSLPPNDDGKELGKEENQNPTSSAVAFPHVLNTIKRLERLFNSQSTSQKSVGNVKMHHLTVGTNEPKGPTCSEEAHTLLHSQQQQQQKQHPSPPQYRALSSSSSSCDPPLLYFDRVLTSGGPLRAIDGVKNIQWVLKQLLAEGRRRPPSFVKEDKKENEEKSRDENNDVYRSSLKIMIGGGVSDLTCVEILSALMSDGSDSVCSPLSTSTLLSLPSSVAVDLHGSLLRSSNVEDVPSPSAVRDATSKFD